MDRLQLLLKQRTARFQPAVDFRQYIREREVGDSRLKTGQDRHDRAASFRSPGGLAGASSFANFRFPTHIAFAEMIGGLDIRVFDKHEQAIYVVSQLALQKDESCDIVSRWLDDGIGLRRRLHRDDRFFTAIAK